jgi:CelD/BcsL family acetyltransferase involved in cellulose biosynthesis
MKTGLAAKAGLGKAGELVYCGKILILILLLGIVSPDMELASPGLRLFLAMVKDGAIRMGPMRRC